MIKRLFNFLFLSVLTVELFGQGTIRFNNRVPGLVDAPVFHVSSTTLGMGPGAKAQLFHVRNSGGSTVYEPLLPITTFHGREHGGFPLAMAYVVEPSEAVVVPGVLPGQNATVVLRAWEGDSFESYQWKYESFPVTITLGGQLPNGDVLSPAPLIGLQSVSLTVVVPDILMVWTEGENMRFHVVPFYPTPDYILEGSSDFVVWQPLITNTVSTFTLPIDRSAVPTYFRMRKPEAPQ